MAASAFSVSWSSAGALARVVCCGQLRRASREAKPWSLRVRAWVVAIGDAGGRIKPLWPSCPRAQVAKHFVIAGWPNTLKGVAWLMLTLGVLIIIPSISMAIQMYDWTVGTPNTVIRLILVVPYFILLLAAAQMIIVVTISAIAAIA